MKYHSEPAIGMLGRIVSDKRAGFRILRPFILLSVLCGLLLIQASLVAQTTPSELPAPVQTYFIPLPEDDLLIGMDKLNPDINSPTHTVVSIVVGANDLIIYYDHWEDGYEVDISKPRRSSSQIWGDGRPANGAPPGFPDDLLNAGDVIVLENDIVVPRDPDIFAFDGKDRFSSTDPVAVTRAAWPLFDPGSKASGAVEVYDTNRFGNQFTAPVGVNTESDEMFEYVALMIMAKDDDTVVTVDKNADGAPDEELTLNSGQNYLAEDVQAGASVEASNPVQVHMLTGDIEATYETRSFTLFSTDRWDSNYLSPVGTTNLADGPANIFLYNPHSDPLAVSWFTVDGEQPTITVPPNGTYRLLLEDSSGTLFSTADERPFYALATVDSNAGTNEIYDWGFSLVPQQVLSTAALVGWGPGNLDTPCTTGSNPEQHAPASPLWVVPTVDTELHVDFDGDPSTGDLVDVNGNRFDMLIDLAALESVQLFDSDEFNGDFDQTSTIVYVTDANARIAVAWGQDPAIGRQGSLCNLDLGTGILPLPNFLAAKSVKVSEERIPDGIANAGETLMYEITISQFGPTLVPNIHVFDELPEHTSYVPNSATARGSIDGLDISDDSSGTPFPFDEDGLFIGDLPVRGEVVLSFEVLVDRPFPKGVDTVYNQAIVSALGQEAVPEVSIPIVALPDLVIEKDDGDALAIPAQTTAYTLTFWNEGGRNADGVVLTETVPQFTSFNAVDSTAGWSCAPDGSAGSTCTFPIEQLVVDDAPQTAVFAVTVNADLPSSVTLIENSVSISDDGSNGEDRFPGNNSDEDDSPVPDFTAEKTAVLVGAEEGDSAAPNDTIRYTIDIVQVGEARVPDVRIFDEIPANTTYVAGSTQLNGEPVADDGDGTPFPLDAADGYLLGDIPAGEAFAVTFDVTIDYPFAAGVTEVVNTAVVTAAGKQLEPTVVTAVSAAPDLVISKTDDGASAVPGRDLLYTLTFANEGTQNATGVVIRESVPSGTQFNAASSAAGWDCSGGNSCTYAIDELVAGEAETAVEFAVIVNENLPESVLELNNTATIADDGTNGADPTPENNSADETTPVPQFMAAKTATVSNDLDGDGQADAGETIRYEVTITQMGEAPVPDVRLSDIVPAYTSYVAGTTQLLTPDAQPIADGDGGTFPLDVAGGVLLGDIPVGGTFTVVYEMKVDDIVPAGAEEIVNQAVVSSPGKEQTVIVETPLHAVPDLMITIDDGGIQSIAGDTIVYEVKYGNIGNQDATGVAASVVISDYVSLNPEASTLGWSCSGDLCTFPVSELPVGSDMGTLLLAVTVDAELPDGMGVLVEAVAEIDDDGVNGEDPTPENNRDDEDTPVPRFRSTKSYTVVGDSDGDGLPDPGEVVEYTILIEQVGDVPVTELRIYDTIPELTSYVAGSTIVSGAVVADDADGTPFPLDAEPEGIPLDDIPVGGAITVAFQVRIDEPFPAGVEEIVNTAVVRSFGQEESPSVTMPIDATPDLRISKTDNGASAVPGREVIYTLTYSNDGSQNATGVTISEQVPSLSSFSASASTSGWTCEGTTCTLAIGDLIADGESAEVAFAVRVDETLPESVERIDNTASIADDGTNGPDPTPANNQDSDYSPVPNFSASKVAIVVTDLNGNGVADAGDTLQYELSITQIGEAPVPDVRVSDIVPEYTSYVAGSTQLLTPEASPIPDGEGGTFPLLVAGGYELGDIPVGATYTVVYQMKVDDSVPAGVDTILNQATVSTPGRDETPFVETPLAAQPDLTIDIDDGGIQSVAGDTIVYDVDYSNVGNQDAVGVLMTVVVTDHVTMNLSASSPGWACTGSTCTFAVAELPAGSNPDSLDFAVTVEEELPNGMGVLILAGSEIADDGSNGADPTPENNVDDENTPVPRFQAVKESAVAEDRDGDGLASAGDVIEYTILISQLGEVPVTDLHIFDEIPANTAYVAGSTAVSGEAVADDSAGSAFPLDGDGLALADIPVGGTTLVSFRVTVDDPFPAGVEEITNVATVTSFGQEERPEVTTPITAVPDLSITKDDAGASAVPGRDVAYTLTFSNDGNQDATGVILNESLPANTSFNASASTAGWACSGSSCTLAVGELAADGEETAVTFVVTVDGDLPESITSMNNTVTVQDDGANGPDPTPENNSADEQTPVPQFTAEKIVSVVDDVDGDGLADPGDTVQYEISITQVGEAPVPDVTVSDIVPEFTSYVAGSTQLLTPDPSPIADVEGESTFPLAVEGGHLIGDIPVGSTYTVIFQVKLDDQFPAGVEEIANQATVRSPGREVTPQVILEVDAEPDLAISITDDNVQSEVGGTVVYTVAYDNLGNQDASGVEVAVTFNDFVSLNDSESDSGWSCVGNSCTFSVGDLATGEGGSLALAMQVDDTLPGGDGVMIEATAEIGDDGSNGPEKNLENNVDNEETPVPRFTAVKESTLLNDADGDGEVGPGDTVEYTITISQAGAVAVPDVRLYDTIPALTSYVAGSTMVDGTAVADSDSGFPFDVEGGLLVGDIAIGGSIVATFQVTIDDPLPAGVVSVYNQATVTTFGQEEQPDVTTPISAAPDLIIEKDDNGQSAVPGQSVVYELTYRNNGVQSATGVTLVETVPAFTTFDATNSTAGWTCDDVTAGSRCTYSVGELEADNIRQRVDFAVLVDVDLPGDVMQLENTAEIEDDGANGPDPTPENNVATDVTYVPRYTAVKEAVLINDVDGDGRFDIGDTIQYRITVTQVGGSPLNNVTVFDTVPENTTYVPDSAQLVVGDDATLVDDASGELFPFDIDGGFALPSIPVGGSATIVFEVEIQECFVDRIFNVAIVNNGIDRESIRKDVILDTGPDLVLWRADVDETAVAGGTISYEYTYFNVGNNPASGATISIVVPEHTSFNANGSAADWACTLDANGDMVCTYLIGDVITGDAPSSVTFALTVDPALPEDVTMINTRAVISDDGSHGLDPAPGNNVAESEISDDVIAP